MQKLGREAAKLLSLASILLKIGLVKLLYLSIPWNTSAPTRN